jgi:hypothetical protein
MTPAWVWNLGPGRTLPAYATGLATPSRLGYDSAVNTDAAQPDAARE